MMQIPESIVANHWANQSPKQWEKDLAAIIEKITNSSKSGRYSETTHCHKNSFSEIQKLLQEKGYQVINETKNLDDSTYTFKVDWSR